MEYNFLVTPDDPPPIIGTTDKPITIKNFTSRMFVKDVGKAYQALGGLSWLITQAQAAPAEFMKLLQKMMPRTMDIDLMEGTTIKLIDQFGKSVEITGTKPAPTKFMKSRSALPDGAATSGSLDEPELPTEVNLIETFEPGEDDDGDNDTIQLYPERVPDISI